MKASDRHLLLIMASDAAIIPLNIANLPNDILVVDDLVPLPSLLVVLVPAHVALVARGSLQDLVDGDTAKVAVNRTGITLGTADALTHPPTCPRIMKRTNVRGDTRANMARVARSATSADPRITWLTDAMELDPRNQVRTTPSAV